LEQIFKNYLSSD